MSKTICIVALLVLAMIINVSASTVTITSYNDANCNSVAGSQSQTANQCFNNKGSYQMFVCNGTAIQETIYSDSACQTKTGVAVNFVNGQCVPAGGLSAKVECTSSAWMFAPSVLLIAMVAALTSFGVKGF